MKRLLLFLLVLYCFQFDGVSQVNDTVVLNFQEYLGYVKQFHPIAKQANLVLTTGEANLLKARGSFDPKLEIDYTTKDFKSTDYFDILNATFKIPTWYGIEFKANFEENTGAFLNPQLTVPEEGLYSAGISASLLKGFLINERMATLKKAKLFEAQTQADRILLINEVLFDAATAYFDWTQAYQELNTFNQFLSNAQIRFQGIKRGAVIGDVAAIDSVEAKITVQNRKLGLEQAVLAFAKASLTLSNFLWLENNVPLELQEGVIPDIDVLLTLDTALAVNERSLQEVTLENHPKLQSLDFKIQSLEVDRRLKANKLLPQLDAQYNFLTQTPDASRSIASDQFKAGIQFSFPLFLRKERGDLRLAEVKLQDASFTYFNTQIALKNKILAVFQEINSLQLQLVLIQDIVTSYETLLSAELRKFDLGESSVFLINARERSLIDAQLKQIALINKFSQSKAKLFNTLAVDPVNL